jgi:hypothetical protein
MVEARFFGSGRSKKLPLKMCEKYLAGAPASVSEAPEKALWIVDQSTAACSALPEACALAEICWHSNIH